MGQLMRAARWLMLLNWNAAPYLIEGKAQPTPLETIFIAYDNIRGFELSF